jgi:hypothetical protein
MGSHTRVVEAIDTEAQEIRKEAALQIAQVEVWRDLELTKLEQAKLIFAGHADADPGTSAAGGGQAEVPERRRRSGRRKRTSTSAKAVAERRDNVFRLISESAEPVASGELVKGLGITTHAAHTALQQLLKERRIARLGSSASTRYLARTKLQSPAARGSRPRGTLQGQIVTTIRDRTYATAEELGQALGEPVEHMVELCGSLQAEGEIQMDRRGGKPVYVLGAA